MRSDITYTDILEKVYELDEFGYIGSKDPGLSRPMLHKRDGKWYCVFMVYEDIYETIPDYYIITDLEEIEPVVYEPVDAMEFLGMPEELLYEEDDPRVFYKDREDLMELFERCLSDEDGIEENFNFYLDAVLECARPTAVRFYEFFRIM